MDGWTIPVFCVSEKLVQTKHEVITEHISVVFPSPRSLYAAVHITQRYWLSLSFPTPIYV